MICGGWMTEEKIQNHPPAVLSQLLFQAINTSKGPLVISMWEIDNASQTECQKLPSQ